MASLKTGIVIAVQLVKHLCRVLTTWRPKIDGVIDAAVAAGHVSSIQAGVLKTWLDGAQAACDVLKIITGY